MGTTAIEIVWLEVGIYKLSHPCDRKYSQSE